MVPPAKIGRSSEWGWMAARTFPLWGCPDSSRSTKTLLPWAITRSGIWGAAAPRPSHIPPATVWPMNLRLSMEASPFLIMTSVNFERRLALADENRSAEAARRPVSPRRHGGHGGFTEALVIASEPHTAEVGNRRCTPINADGNIRVHRRSSAVSNSQTALLSTMALVRNLT